MRGRPRLSRIAALALATLSTATYVDCPRTHPTPATLTCPNFQVVMEPNTCSVIGNPCGRGGPEPGQPWAAPPFSDDLRLFDKPESIYIKTERTDGVTTRSAAFTFTRNQLHLSLDASTSTGNIVSYAWDFSWTATAPDVTAASPTAAVTTNEGDRGTITLTVTAADGATASVTRRFP